MTYTQFLAKFALGYQEHISSTSPHLLQRQGQFYYNLLDDLRPEVAAKLRGSGIDPFYSELVIQAVHDYVETVWDNNR